MASAASNYNKTLIQIQKLANNSAKSIQSMINKSNKQQMTFNSAEAQKSRDWQEAMSKSAHQMEVADLKKAGLNPVLSTGGSGAQSYTTSSASTTNDSGSSAAAAMFSQELGAMSNMESARMTADAQLKASTQQAKATRYAAQQSAAAQKYAASQNYAAAVYKANLAYQTNKENIQQDKWRTKNATANSWAGFLDKFIRNSGMDKMLYGSDNKQNLKAFFNGKGNANRKVWLESKPVMFKNGNSASAKNFSLTKVGSREATNALRSMNFVVTKKSQDLFVKGVIFRDQNSVKNLWKYHKSQMNPNLYTATKVAPGYR